MPLERPPWKPPKKTARGEAGVRRGVAHDERSRSGEGRIHTTIAVPGATAQSMGLPDNNKQGGVWIMNAGTSTAHLMIPGS